MIYFKYQNIGNSSRFPIFLFWRNQLLLGISWIIQVELAEQSPGLTGEKSVMTSELGEDWD